MDEDYDYAEGADDFLDDIESYTDADYLDTAEYYGYEDGYEDYEPSPYDGTYSEE